MIFVQPLPVPLFQQGNLHTVKIDGHTGQILKVHKLSVCILLPLSAKQFIFDSDSMTSLYIDSRLIRGHHSFLQHCIILVIRHQLPPEAIRSLMNVHKIAYPMTGSVFIVKSLLPEYLSCLDIQIDSPASVKKHTVLQVQHGAKHQCIVTLFLLAHRT